MGGRATTRQCSICVLTVTACGPQSNSACIPCVVDRTPTLLAVTVVSPSVPWRQMPLFCCSPTSYLIDSLAPLPHLYHYSRRMTWSHHPSHPHWEQHISGSRPNRTQSPSGWGVYHSASRAAVFPSKGFGLQGCGSGFYLLHGLLIYTGNCNH